MKTGTRHGIRTTLAAAALTFGGSALACLDNPYFPGSAGATWTYSTSFGTHTQTILASTDTSFIMQITDGDGFTAEIEYLCQPDGSILVDMNSVMTSGDAASMLEEAGVEFELVHLDGITFPADLSVGDTWESVSVTEATMSIEGIAGMMTNTLSVSYRVDRREAVTVPAGTFSDAFVLSSDMNMETVTTVMGMSIPFSFDFSGVMWLVEGVGMVRSVDGDGDVMELLGYSIP